METTDILLVDDNPDIRRLLHAMLGRGRQIAEAEDGTSALRLIRELRPRLVFMDVMMPGDLNGLQVLSKLREDPVLLTTPVVMVSARGQEEDLRNAVRHGADGYVVKPFGLKDLQPWVTKYLA